jgi:hypothetical protein
MLLTVRSLSFLVSILLVSRGFELVNARSTGELCSDEAESNTAPELQLFWLVFIEHE